MGIGSTDVKILYTNRDSTVLVGKGNDGTNNLLMEDDDWSTVVA